MTERASPGLVAPGLALLVLTAATPFALRFGGDNAFIACALAAGGAYLVAAGRAHRAAADALPAILALAVLLRLALLAHEPFLSQDMYRYIWDGRIGNAGFNPFLFVPRAPELTHLRGVPWFDLIDKADYAVTIYPPGAQLLFRAIAAVTQSTVGFRLAFLALDAVAIACLVDMLRRLGRPAGLVLLYAWHPLIPIEVAGNGHLDGPMTALVVVGLWLFQRGGERLAGAPIALAALMKPTALLALPALWRPWRVALPAVVLATIVLAYLPYAELGRGAVGFLPRYLAEERIAEGSAFWLLEVARAALGTSGGLVIYLTVSAAALAGLALRAGFRRSVGFDVRVRDSLVLMSTALFLLSPDYPWYALILVPYLALAGPRPLAEPAAWPALALSLAGFVLYDVIAGDPQVHFTLRDAGFNVLVLGAFAAAWFGARRAAKGGAS
jgi:hypothetical protein